MRAAAAATTTSCLAAGVRQTPPAPGPRMSVETLRPSQLDSITIGQCRRLQEQVFNPNPEWDGSVSVEQFVPKPEAELTAGAALQSEIRLVRARPAASGERWHIVRDEITGAVIAKAHTHLRALVVVQRLPRGGAAAANNDEQQQQVLPSTVRTLTVVGLSGVNVHPDARGRGLGTLVVRSAFGQVSASAAVACLFQTGSAMPFYQRLGARVVDSVALVTTVNGPEGLVRQQPAFTDSYVMIWPATARWPQRAGTQIDTQGYTGSWAWWREFAPGRPPPHHLRRDNSRRASKL